MAIQKIASKISTVVSLVAANTTGAKTSSAITLSSYGYPKVARLIISGTATGGTLDGYLTCNATGSHVKITGSDCTQVTTASSNVGPEVVIPAGSTEIKSVVTMGVVTEGMCAVVEMGEKSFES